MDDDSAQDRPTQDTTQDVEDNLSSPSQDTITPNNRDPSGEAEAPSSDSNAAADGNDRPRITAGSYSSSNPDPTIMVAGALALFNSVLNTNDTTRGRASSSRYARTNETDPLLPSSMPNNNNNNNGPKPDEEEEEEPATKARAYLWTALTVLFAGTLVLFLFFDQWAADRGWPWSEHLPSDPLKAALVLMDRAPVIDGHIDLPILVRYVYKNNVTGIDLNSPMPAHVDIPRLRAGKVGGFFWSVYVGCADPDLEGPDFLGASWRVRDTLEQIDVARLLIAKYPDTFQLALSSEEMKSAMADRKIASLLGVEGAHQLGNSLAVLRQYYTLGVRYLTLTHTCRNAFADSCGFEPGMEPLHHGLSTLGVTLITELNRLGMLVDLSHTSDETALAVLKLTRAPVIWSHSSARAVWDVPRNVPDNVLQSIKDNGVDAVVMVNFAPYFVAAEGNATVKAVADHVEHIKRVAGAQYVGIGSDFDGIGSTPEGLEDVSKYPALIAELISRGWSEPDIAGLTGGNLLRVMAGAEQVSIDMQREGVQAAFDIYSKRKDMDPW